MIHRKRPSNPRHTISTSGVKMGFLHACSNSEFSAILAPMCYCSDRNGAVSSTLTEAQEEAGPCKPRLERNKVAYRLGSIRQDGTRTCARRFGWFGRARLSAQLHGGIQSSQRASTQQRHGPCYPRRWTRHRPNQSSSAVRSTGGFASQQTYETLIVRCCYLMRELPLIG